MQVIMQHGRGWECKLIFYLKLFKSDENAVWIVSLYPSTSINPFSTQSWWVDKIVSGGVDNPQRRIYFVRLPLNSWMIYIISLYIHVSRKGPPAG